MPAPGSRLDQGWRCGGLLCSLSPDDTKATCHRARSSSHYPCFYSSVSFYDSSQNAPKAVRHEYAYLASVCSWARLCSIRSHEVVNTFLGIGATRRQHSRSVAESSHYCVWDGQGYNVAGGRTAARH